jgi:hypothetical protein
VSYVDREHPRYAHHAELTTWFRGRLHSGHTVNVSRGGLCCLMKADFSVGVDLVIDIALHFEDGARSEAISLRARVVWCTAIDDLHQVGMALVSPGGDELSHLDMFLRYLDKGASAAP